METLNYIGAQETLHPRLGFKELRQLAMPHIVSSQTRPGLGPQEMETAGDNSHRELPGQSSAGKTTADERQSVQDDNNGQ